MAKVYKKFRKDGRRNAWNSNPGYRRRALALRKTKSYRLKQREVQLGRHVSLATRKKISISRTREVSPGVTVAQAAWTEAQKEAQRQRRLGKKNSLETREKLSKANKGQEQWHLKGKTYEEIYGFEKAAAIKRKMSKGHKGRVPYWVKGKTYEEIYGEKKAKELKKLRSKTFTQCRKERPELFREIRAQQVLPVKDSRPEKLVQDYLRKSGIAFKTHRGLPGLFHQFDILVPELKLAIEVDGCYWHGCRKCFPNAQLEFLAKENGERCSHSACCKNNGFTLVRIWEHDVRAGKFTSIRKVLESKSGKEMVHG